MLRLALHGAACAGSASSSPGGDDPTPRGFDQRGARHGVCGRRQPTGRNARRIVVFTTGAESVKGQDLRRDPRVAVCVDDETPPYAFAVIEGRARISTDREERLAWASRIAARYVGQDRSEEVSKLNGGEGELLVRVTPTHTVSENRVAA